MKTAIFGSASSMGWMFAYEADDRLQQIIKHLAERYNSAQRWEKRNRDGSVSIYDTAQAAVDDTRQFCDDCDAEDLGGLLAYYRGEGDPHHDGFGAVVDAAWVVYMLLGDGTEHDPILATIDMVS